MILSYTPMIGAPLFTAFNWLFCVYGTVSCPSGVVSTIPVKFPGSTRHVATGTQCVYITSRNADPELGLPRTAITRALRIS
jgi:hypothetical protein